MDHILRTRNELISSQSVYQSALGRGVFCVRSDVPTAVLWNSVTDQKPSSESCMAGICNFSVWKRREGDLRFEASMCYTVPSSL